MEVRLERSWMAVREEESGVKALLVSCSVCPIHMSASRSGMGREPLGPS